ncbi:hypothetical protein M5K25_026588 [Dendrobium thyrsiflorum]|uniref:Ubiquitin-like protease family profile domain-containing protein n=1 Tax=Dendrobium thyrsiflorum TaxID=117978 RepID=A0ABD0TXV9_DENTH
MYVFWVPLGIRSKISYRCRTLTFREVIAEKKTSAVDKASEKKIPAVEAVNDALEKKMPAAEAINNIPIKIKASPDASKDRTDDGDDEEDEGFGSTCGTGMARRGYCKYEYDTKPYVAHVDKESVRASNLLLLTVVEQDHWTLLVANLKSSVCHFFDSLPNLTHRAVLPKIVS